MIFSPEEVVLLDGLVSSLRDLELHQRVPDEVRAGPFFVPVVHQEQLQAVRVRHCKDRCVCIYCVCTSLDILEVWP